MTKNLGIFFSIACGTIIVLIGLTDKGHGRSEFGLHDMTNIGITTIIGALIYWSAKSRSGKLSSSEVVALEWLGIAFIFVLSVAGYHPHSDQFSNLLVLFVAPTIAIGAYAYRAIQSRKAPIKSEDDFFFYQ